MPTEAIQALNREKDALLAAPEPSRRNNTHQLIRVPLSAVVHRLREREFRHSRRNRRGHVALRARNAGNSAASGSTLDLAGTERAPFFAAGEGPRRNATCSAAWTGLAN